jgi:hypothetical protein
MDSWQQDVKKAYTGFGAIMSYSFPPSSGSYTVYGVRLNYVNGLNYTWNQRISFSAANATGNLNITSIGLTGYKFTSTVFLKMNITDALWYKGKGNDPGQVGVRVIIEAEGPTTVTNLQKGNFLPFLVDGVDKTQNSTLYRYYESKGHPVQSQNPPYPALNAYVYELRYTATKTKPSSVSVVITVGDSRGIQVTGAFNIPASLIIDY